MLSEQNDSGKMILSIIAAFVLCAILAQLLMLPINGFLLSKNIISYTYWEIFWFLVVYTAIFGRQHQGELERSVGALFGQMTPWIIPAGFSIWFPWPLGKAVRKESVETRKIDHTREGGKELTEVVAADGGKVKLSFFVLYDIVDLRTFVSQEGGGERAMQVIVDRAARVFATAWDCDGKYSIAQKKVALSDYLIGKTVKDRDGNDMDSDIVDRATAIGCKIRSAASDNIDPPAKVVEANEKKISELAQRDKETLDNETFQRNVLQHIYGNKWQEKLNELSADGKRIDYAKPPYAAAAKYVAANKGVLNLVRVEGDGGDFLKAEALRQSNNKS